MSSSSTRFMMSNGSSVSISSVSWNSHMLLMIVRISG